MTLSAISVSRNPVDLLTDKEREILKAAIDYIETRTEQAKQNLVQVLSQLITTSYLIGGDKAAQEIGHRGPLGLQGLEPVAEKLGDHLDKTFGSLGDELTGVIRDGLKEGKSYNTVRDGLSEKIQGGWGKTIRFDSVGQIRDSIQVNPDGSMKRIKTTIQKPVTISSDTYAETISRTSMKQAYVAGHYTRYEEAGYPGWVYISVADERTRPRHLALHGRTFFFNTPEEQMARAVMAEYNCRCRPKAFFGDPKYDTPEKTYAEQRKEWSTQTFDEWKVDKNMPLFIQENPRNGSELNALLPRVQDRMQGNDWQILGYQMGKSTEQMARDTVKTLKTNFVFRKEKREYAFTHIYRDHILRDTSRATGEPPFTMNEVIKAKQDGILYKHNGETKALWTAPDGRRLNVIMSDNYPGKIVTAYRIRQKDWNKIVKGGEKLDR